MPLLAKGDIMSELELFKSLTSSEYKLWCFVRFVRVETGRENYTPDYDRIADGMNTSRRSAMRLTKQLRDKGLL